MTLLRRLWCRVAHRRAWHAEQRYPFPVTRCDRCKERW